MWQLDPLGKISDLQDNSQKIRRGRGQNIYSRISRIGKDRRYSARYKIWNQHFRSQLPFPTRRKPKSTHSKLGRNLFWKGSDSEAVVKSFRPKLCLLLLPAPQWVLHRSPDKLFLAECKDPPFHPQPSDVPRLPAPILMMLLHSIIYKQIMNE